MLTKRHFWLAISVALLTVAFTYSRGAGAQPVGVILALDRQERGQGPLSAVQEVEQTLQLPVSSILRLADLIEYLKRSGDAAQLAAIQRYRSEYGVSD